jgi:hypothetical protein
VLSRAETEVWFKKVGAGRLVPVHWKGFALLLGTVVIVVPSFWLGWTTGQPVMSALYFGVCVVAFFTLFALAERHST